MAASADDHELERAHYMEVRHAFLEYSAYMERDLVQRTQQKLLGLPPGVAKMLSAETTKRCDRKHESPSAVRITLSCECMKTMM